MAFKSRFASDETIEYKMWWNCFDMENFSDERKLMKECLQEILICGDIPDDVIRKHDIIGLVETFYVEEDTEFLAGLALKKLRKKEESDEEDSEEEVSEDEVLEDEHIKDDVVEIQADSSQHIAQNKQEDHPNGQKKDQLELYGLDMSDESENEDDEKENEIQVVPKVHKPESSDDEEDKENQIQVLQKVQKPIKKARGPAKASKKVREERPYVEDDVMKANIQKIIDEFKAERAKGLNEVRVPKVTRKRSRVTSSYGSRKMKKMAPGSSDFPEKKTFGSRSNGSPVTSGSHGTFQSQSSSESQYRTPKMTSPGSSRPSGSTGPYHI